MNRQQRQEMTHEDEAAGMPLAELCEVEVMETNVDDKYLGAPEYQSALRTCRRRPCRCREEGCY